MTPRPEDHLAMVTAIARRYVRGRRLMDSEEWADGAVGLVAAAARFDPARCLKFSTFAWPYILGYILSGIDRRTRRKSSRLRTEPLGCHDPRARDESSLLEIRELARHVLDGCQARDRAILWELHALNWTLSRVAEKWGISKVRVQQLRDRAMRKVRQRGAAKREKPCAVENNA